MINQINKQRVNLKKVASLIVITTILFSSCIKNDSNKISQLEKYIDICKSEITLKTVDFEAAFRINPIKYGKPFMDSRELQKNFDEIYNSLDNNNLEVKDKLKTIKEQSNSYCEYLTREKIDFLLSSDLQSIERNNLKLLLLELNSVMISEFHKRVTESDLNFNVISAYILPKEKVIKCGETYVAKVIIGALDSTLLPKINFEDQSKNIKSTHNLIEIKGEKRGKFKSRGDVELVDSKTGITRRLVFEFEYEVK